METSTTIIRSDELQASFNTNSIEANLEYRDMIREPKLASFAIQHCARRMLPYGIWICQDGREVVFNREYQPIFQKINGVNSFADRSEWVKDIVNTIYLYNDGNSPIDFMRNKYEDYKLTSRDKKDCKKSLLICLSVIKKYQPKEARSTNRAYSF